MFIRSKLASDQDCRMGQQPNQGIAGPCAAASHIMHQLPPFKSTWLAGSPPSSRAPCGQELEEAEKEAGIHCTGHVQVRCNQGQVMGRQ